MTDVYERSIDRIGLLSEREISEVLRAYILIRQMPDRMKILSRKYASEEEKARGFALSGGHYIEAVRQMHGNYLYDIDLALSELT